MKNDDIISTLIQEAKRASKKSYSPYSQFPVGCAFTDDKGNIFSGCNVENISYGLSNCAERSAIFKAIGEIGPNLIITNLVIYTPTNTPTSPCGACRQVIKEFSKNSTIISFCDGEDIIEGTINELLPDSPTLDFKPRKD